MRKSKTPNAVWSGDGGAKAIETSEQKLDSTTDSSPASEPAPSPLELEQQMTRRALARVLAGEKAPDDPNVKPEHRRVLYRVGDSQTIH
jgi:hypothetical protein